MRSSGVVMYKGIEERAGGSFKNDKGQTVDYDKCYVLKFDEIIDGKINERKLKFPFADKNLYDKFIVFEPYTMVDLFCDVVFMQNACKLVPINVELHTKK